MREERVREQGRSLPYSRGNSAGSLRRGSMSPSVTADDAHDGVALVHLGDVEVEAKTKAEGFGLGFPRRRRRGVMNKCYIREPLDVNA